MSDWQITILREIVRELLALLFSRYGVDLKFTELGDSDMNHDELTRFRDEILKLAHVDLPGGEESPLRVVSRPLVGTGGDDYEPL
jgi:hypothetical protein